MKARNTSGSKFNLLEGNLAHIIAHEICHQLITEEIGYFRMRKTGNWKLEGFCEYTASKRRKTENDTYQFREFAADYFNGQFDELPAGRKLYLKSLLLTEYYLSYLDRSFTELVHNKVSEYNLLDEIRDRYYRNNL